MKVQLRRHINEEPQVLNHAGRVRDVLRHLISPADRCGPRPPRGRGPRCVRRPATDVTHRCRRGRRSGHRTARTVERCPWRARTGPMPAPDDGERREARPRRRRRPVSTHPNVRRRSCLASTATPPRGRPHLRDGLAIHEHTRPTPIDDHGDQFPGALPPTPTTTPRPGAADQFTQMHAAYVYKVNALVTADRHDLAPELAEAFPTESATANAARPDHAGRRAAGPPSVATAPGPLLGSAGSPAGHSTASTATPSTCSTPDTSVGRILGDPNAESGGVTPLAGSTPRPPTSTRSGAAVRSHRPGASTPFS